MDSRRDFLRKAALMSGSAAMINVLPPAIQKALAIAPDPGSTFYDAEHIVFLMQENRSFDHGFGTLQGVRGFNDPRAIDLPDKNKVWLQTNPEGETFGPFHVDVKDTKVAWMGSVPHSWADQTDARNDGKYDRWLEVKKSRSYGNMPLTLAYCTREDYPFYYSLADAFTICDQHFCSAIAGTQPNRHYWMTGTNREEQVPESPALLYNLSNKVTPSLGWKTYPERLEENGVSWKIYQNEITMGYGLQGENDGWLGNFVTNVMEFYKQYNTRLQAGSIAYLAVKKENILKEIASLEQRASTQDVTLQLAAAKKVLATIEADQLKYNQTNYNKLSAYQKNLMAKAFVTNVNDPDYHDLAPLKYKENGVDREINIPKGDVLHQFRQDVQNGTLPTVSYLHAPGNLSDHPGTPWFGPLYVSEVMNILTDNPEVWKKTIFILTYDENDGYFDHIPPFVVPNPYRDDTGKVSNGVDTKMDFSKKDQQNNPSAMPNRLRDAPIGLGFRVPMIIASPWTRGGFVCSEVFDHTSSLQFMENFLEKKFNKKVKEENITGWRRAICGDLTSAFRPYNNEKIVKPAFLQKDPFIGRINNAQFKKAPGNYKKLSQEEIAAFNKDPYSSPHLPAQEKGVRSACALPYELYADGLFNMTKKTFGIHFKAGNRVFGSKAIGSPFYVYAMNPYKKEDLRSWNYSAVAGDTLIDEWSINDFDNANYHLRVYGPNGFYREFRGDNSNPPVMISLSYEQNSINKNKLTGNVSIAIRNHDTKPQTFVITDKSYKAGTQTKTLAPGFSDVITLNLTKNYNWYDLSVKLKGYETFEERFAGRVETGAITKTDPLMGRVV